MNIVVLAGGLSTERDVSLCSGSLVCGALRKKGHDAIVVDAFLGIECKSEDIGDLFLNVKDKEQEIIKIPEEEPNLDEIKKRREDGGKNYFGPNVLEACTYAGAVFMALHGDHGEDGRIQAAFDLFGIKYTGTDYLGSGIAMDKDLTKKILDYEGLPTAKWICIENGIENKDKNSGKENSTVEGMIEKVLEAVALPCVVKPCRGGSSIGVSITNTVSELKDALEKAGKYHDRILIEEYIKGREFSVGIFDGKALPVIEIIPLKGWYDYRNKFQAGFAKEVCPAELTPEETREIQKLAERTHKALRLGTYARIDFLLDENNEFYCLEANTLPGMTPTSLLPQEAQSIGISYEDLCEKIVKAAL